MVRGIYQTSEATKTRSGIVSAAVAVLVVVLAVGGGLKFLWDWGDSICSMAYYSHNSPGVTYREHAERALARAGFRCAKLKDLGDDPPYERYEPNPKMRKFLARDLEIPGGKTLEKAHVYVEFDSWNQRRGVTTVKWCEEIK